MKKVNKKKSRTKKAAAKSKQTLKTKKGPSSILLGTDLTIEPTQESHKKAVYEVADRFAQKLKKTIDLLYVEDLRLYPIDAPIGPSLIDPYLREFKDRLGKMAQTFRSPTQALFTKGEPAQKIIALGRKKQTYELVVLGTHGHTGLARLFLGSVAEEVIRHLTLPVMTVGPKAQSRAQEFLANTQLKILVPTSLTPNSTHAEEYAASLAKRLGGSLVLFHSLYESVHPILQSSMSVPTPVEQIQKIMTEMKKNAIQTLTKKTQNFSKKLPCSFVVNDRMLSAAEGILAEANHSPVALIVMGTHGRSLLSQAFFGRTARDVILESPVPVITVRSKKA